MPPLSVVALIMMADADLSCERVEGKGRVFVGRTQRSGGRDLKNTAS